MASKKIIWLAAGAVAATLFAAWGAAKADSAAGADDVAAPRPVSVPDAYVDDDGAE